MTLVRQQILLMGAAAEPGEHREVREMQRAEHQEDLSDLDREQLQPLPGAVDVPAEEPGPGVRT